MKVLVTGTSGFLGGAIRRHLISKGFDTYGTTRSRPPEDDQEFQFDITSDSCNHVFNNIEFDVFYFLFG